MNYNLLVYNILTTAISSITPTLPGIPVGGRVAVGTPEVIPDMGFYTRKLLPTDDVFDDIAHLNVFIANGKYYHDLHGVRLTEVNSVEDFLERFTPVSTPLGRIRIVSHGMRNFMFFPLFKGGSWNNGLSAERLEAFHKGEDAGLRILVSSSDPWIRNISSKIVSGLKIENPAVLTPFGTLPFTGDNLIYLNILCDKLLVSSGTLLVSSGKSATEKGHLIESTKQNYLTTTLDYMEQLIRKKITAVSVPALDALKLAILTNNQTLLARAFVGKATFAAGTGAQVTTAAGTNDEGKIRDAISMSSGSTLFGLDRDMIIKALTLSSPPSLLKLAGTQIDELTNLSSVSSSLAPYFDILADLFFFKNALLLQGTNPLPADDKSGIQTGLDKLETILRNAVTSSSSISNSSLLAIRTAVNNLPLRATTLVGGTKDYLDSDFNDLKVAVSALNAGFMTKLDHFRSLVDANKTIIDIRGCKVASKIVFLKNFSALFGKDGPPPIRPLVTGPDWYQAYSKGFGDFRHDPKFDTIDNTTTTTVSAVGISAADISQAIDDWKKRIDFATHFTFIKNLFSSSFSKFDFTALEWRKWNSPTVTTGIPVLRMEASRIDDWLSLGFAALLDRFRVIFNIQPVDEIPRATQTRLNSIQPLVAAFKISRDQVLAATAPTAVARTGLATDLTDLVTKIKRIRGIPAAAGTPSPPGSDTLADLKTSVSSIQSFFDNLLDLDLKKFLKAIETEIGLAAAENRYYFNIGLPLVVQDSTTNLHFRFLIRLTASSMPEILSFEKAAIQSFMRIQWQGTPAQATAMNKAITENRMLNFTSVSAGQNIPSLAIMTEEYDVDNPNTTAAIHPSDEFTKHIKQSMP